MTSDPGPPRAPAGTRTPPLTLRRWAFALYACVLAIATHWPGVTIEGPIERPDLVIHLTAFFIWTFLLAVSRLLGDPRQPRTLMTIALVASAYAGLDEFTQRYVNRTSSWDDYAANLLGIGAGIVAIAILTRTRRPAA